MLKAAAERGKELAGNFGLEILLPRVFLYSLVPLFFLLVHSRDPWSFYWFRGSGWLVAFFGGLLLLNVGANLAVSRYLRLHQSEDSPYKYSRTYNLYTNNPYFRIVVKDNAAFRSLIKSLQAEHKGEAISVWLRLDDLMLIPGWLFLTFGLLACGVCWLIWQIFHPLGFLRQVRSWLKFWRYVSLHS
jgi:hypothetical protein